MINKITFKQENYSLPEKMEKIVLKERVNLLRGEWLTHNMNQICPFIHEWNVEHLRASYNSCPVLFKDVENIQFPNLSLLNFGRNAISSVEKLNRIYMPSLKEIYLWENEIVFLRDFKKMHWPVCTKISLTQNNITQGCELAKMKGSSMGQIYFELNQNEIKQVQDIRWVFKLQSTDLFQFCTKSMYKGHQNKQRIKSKQFKRQLSKKYSKIN